MGAVIIAVVAYRRIRSQNVVLNQQNKKSKIRPNSYKKLRKQIKILDNVAHEFRTPLTLILGLLKILLANQAACRAAELTLVKNNTTRLVRLVNQLLDLSKLEAGNTTLEYVYEDIVQFLRSIAFAFQSLADQKKSQSRSKVSPHLY